jgi:5-methylcytosine-specific restriction protein A
MTFEPGIVQGQVIDNELLCQTFGCSPQGGMRRSLKTNTLVLISNHVESIYDDRWLDGVFHYTGMGQKGDQSLTFNQNKTLSESRSNGVEVHLFEVNKEKEYTYQGRVSLAGDPYPETQPDQDKLDRMVYVFPLVLDGIRPSPVATTDFNQAQKIREKKAKKLSDEELFTKASKAPKMAGERTVTSMQCGSVIIDHLSLQEALKWGNKFRKIQFWGNRRLIVPPF